ncbi:MAG: hypothetical protein JWL93_1919 [Hyphomicrobiales bacterium]|nr:hypothetical protein [Hyphomicrobiales bacterium]
MIVGAVLRIDLRGFSGDLPAALGAPMRDAEAPEGTRSLFYDLGSQIEGLTSGEACRRLAVRLDRVFLAPDTPVFEGALAVRLRLDLGLTVPERADSYSHDLPASLLDCLGQMEAELGLTYYPTADESDAVVEDA